MKDIDLIVSSVTAPVYVTLSETIRLSWTVKNLGTDSVLANYWYDYIYISDDQFFDSSDTYLANRYARDDTPLAAGGSYTATQDIFIANGVATGDRYLLFVADQDNYQGETDETNNVFAQAITINAPDVDLVVTTANSPTTAELGQTISVSWTVKNQGTVSALADWFDAVYISDDQFFDNNSDIRLTERSAENTPLASGGSYTITQGIYISNSVVGGDRYLLFVGDLFNYQAETDENNNVFAQAISINAPDLVVTAANAAAIAGLGETISVSWTVKNQGTVPALANWNNFIYISNDQFFDNGDTFLDSRNTGFLGSGNSYTATQDIYIRKDVAGGDVYDGLRQRYLLFVADRNKSQGETDETNNVFAQAITLGQPDLVVTAANAPTIAGLDQTISVSWTVKNQGIVSAFSDWYDYVYISDDQFLDYRDTFLTYRNTGENTPLASGASYTITRDIYIPSYQATGNRYLLFVTDGGYYGYNQDESNETNNVFAQAITVAAPDLVVTAANAPITAALGQAISVSWTVKNQGIVSAFGDWYDYVYISDDQFFGEGDTFLTYRNTGENTPLAPGASYTITQDISIPNSVGGDVYLLFVAAGNNQGETDQTNNVFAQAITINAPDLVVTAVNAPTTAALRETISVSWTVKNQGIVSALNDWYDYIYISDDELFGEGDTYVTNRNTGENTPLAPGASYTITQDIYIPFHTATGNRYLLFVADGNKNQGETDETNNVFAQAITINAPDLVVTAANAPTTAALRETISVSWTVKNQGTVSAFGDWDDAVYISNDQFFDYNDTYLTSPNTGENTPLASGASYTITQDIYIPNDVAGGGRYLLFVTDLQRLQTQTDETNNVFAQAITINAPDLVVTAANAPTTTGLNQIISVSWTVKNQGIVSAFGDWDDTVYISDDQFLDDSDTTLTYRKTRENTPLASGASYTATSRIYIRGYVRPGDRYLLFVANSRRYNGVQQGETDKTNNVLAQAITIVAPDLVVTAANAPTTAALNETISVSWRVENQGTTITSGDWYDYIYISNDQFFDYSDTQLAKLYQGYREISTEFGDSYTVIQDISIPSYLGTGDVYLLFVAGRDNSEPEIDQTNNIFAQVITLTAPDLVVTAANAPTTATLGKTISVSWTVENQGTVSAFGNWYDYIYISDDQFFDNSDTRLTEPYTGENTPLGSGDSYTLTRDILIPNDVTGGDVYLLFFADGGYYGSNQGETNENNNVQAVAISLYAQGQIFKGTSGRDTLTGNDRNNLITGSQGADTLTGGAGSDRFVYTSIRDAGDKITDFLAGTDKIDLSQLFQSLSLGSLDYESATTQGYLSFGIEGTNTTVNIDLDGTTGRARPTPLLTVNSVSQSTLAQSDNFVF
ncbi:MAG: CARDB domain-containing protein [Nostoc sp. EkiNYC01]|nr:CARDB domain-containing protein [Nostoc sp. EkiNYC01]